MLHQVWMWYASVCKMPVECSHILCTYCLSSSFLTARIHAKDVQQAHFYHLNSESCSLCGIQGGWKKEKCVQHACVSPTSPLFTTSTCCLSVNYNRKPAPSLCSKKCAWTFSPYGLTKRSLSLTVCTSHLRALQRFVHFSPADSLYPPRVVVTKAQAKSQKW